MRRNSIETHDKSNAEMELRLQLEKQKNEELEKLNRWREERQLELEESMRESRVQFENEIEELKVLRISQMEEDIEARKEYYRRQKIDLVKWKLAEEEEVEYEVEELKSEIEAWKSRYEAALEDYKRREKMDADEDFYKVELDSVEKLELRELNEAIVKLRNPMPFRKAIYDIYYKNKVNDLVLRVIGKDKVQGIYKITHIESEKSYVGQSVDVGNRWKQHCKRGTGADSKTGNKLYEAMLKYGIESFRFEVVEVVEDSERLSEAEKYWQEYFKSKEFGYSMK